VLITIFSLIILNYVDIANLENAVSQQEEILIRASQCSDIDMQCKLPIKFNAKIYWEIGNLIYDLSVENYPSITLVNSYTLRVLKIDLSYHNTTFQCLSLAPSKQLTGEKIRLIVHEGKTVDTQLLSSVSM